MANETDKILVALLQKQRINQFLPFEKPNACNIDEPLYGFIKDNTFHICDASLKEFIREEVGLNKKTVLLVGYDEKSYTIIDEPTERCFILSETNSIIINNPKHFCKINEDCFFLGEEVNLNEDFKGAIFHCSKRLKSLSDTFDKDGIYKYFEFSDYQDALNVSRQYSNLRLGSCLYVNGELYKTIRYLFTIENRFFFYDTASGDIVSVHSHTSSNIGSFIKNNSFKGNYIWYSYEGGKIIGINPITNQEEDTVDGFEITIDGVSSSCCIKDNSGDSTSISLGRNPKIKATADFFCQSYNVLYGTFILILSSGEEVTLSRYFSDERVYFSNNMLTVRSEYEKGFLLLDCFGNTISSITDSEYRKYNVAELNTALCNIFNPHDTEVYNQSRIYDIKDHRISKDCKHTTYQGVIELETGKTLVPLSFSGVETSTQKEPYSDTKDEDVRIKQVTIVWINHYFDKKKSYYGLFLNDDLVLPISFQEIAFIKYDYYESGSKVSFCQKYTNFIKVKNNELYGVYDSWGNEILPIEAKYVRGLYDNRPSDYVLAYNHENKFRVIYKKSVISDYNYTKCTPVLPSQFGLECYTREVLLKLESGDGISFVYKGEIRAEFDYGEVSIYPCFIENPNVSFDEKFVFLVDNGEMKGVYDSKGQSIFPLDIHNSISIKRSYIDIDGIIYGKSFSPLLDINRAKLINSVRNYNGTILSYLSDKNELILLFFDSTCGADVHIYDNSQRVGLSDQIYDWKYNFDTDEFMYIAEEEDTPYSDYPDDTDYERDTYYALGGDDYDAFRERGGSIDDMMDGMGY